MFHRALSRSFAVVACLALAAVLPLLSAGAAADAPPGRKYALLVGVKNYDKDQLRSLRFTENDVYVANYQWGEGGKLDMTPERTQLMWISKGSVRIGDSTYHARTVVFSDFGESVVVEGTDGAEAVVFGLAVPDPVLAEV